VTAKHVAWFNSNEGVSNERMKEWVLTDRTAQTHTHPTGVVPLVVGTRSITQGLRM
jgi:hypothetical protein